ncbi:MAG TPA: hypothetical protein VKZ63_00395 [Kofleriaceae bacterium]|nr:hypothetical protein [Kofleriaceae bacterium]
MNRIRARPAALHVLRGAGVAGAAGALALLVPGIWLEVERRPAAEVPPAPARER